MNATIEGGTTPVERGNAFYYVGNGTTFGATEISNWAKNNFWRWYDFNFRKFKFDYEFWFKIIYSTKMLV